MNSGFFVENVQTFLSVGRAQESGGLFRRIIGRFYFDIS